MHDDIKCKFTQRKAYLLSFLLFLLLSLFCFMDRSTIPGALGPPPLSLRMLLTPPPIQKVLNVCCGTVNIDVVPKTANALK